MAHEIAERNPQSQGLRWWEFKGRGRIGGEVVRRVGTVLGHAIPVGLLDVAMYR